MKNFSTPIEQLIIFLDWLETGGVDRFDLGVNRHGTTRERDKFIPGQKDLDRNGLIQSLGWLRQENAQGASVYFRPAQCHNWSLVFLDDVSKPMALKIASKYTSAVIETSLGLCHIWIRTAKALSIAERGLVQNWCAKKAGADLGSTSGDHFGRLPGFKNRKPQRNGAWVNLLCVTNETEFDPSVALSSAPDLFPMGRVLNLNQRKFQGSGTRDESAAEYGWVMGQIRKGIDPDIIEKELLEHCLCRRGADAVRYARRTVKQALAHAGSCKLIG